MRLDPQDVHADDAEYSDSWEDCWLNAADFGEEVVDASATSPASMLLCRACCSSRHARCRQTLSLTPSITASSLATRLAGALAAWSSSLLLPLPN